MALATYADLQDAIAGWLAHTLFAGRVTDFISLFEARANRVLRTRFQETSTDLTPTAGVVTLPDDYLSKRSVISLDNPTETLEYVSPDYLTARFPTSTSGIPSIYTIEGSSLTVAPYSVANVRLKYYALIPALSNTNTTNWLLTSHPDAYLFGALTEAELFGVNDERSPIWKARVDAAFTEIMELSRKSQATGGMRIMGPTP